MSKYIKGQFVAANKIRSSLKKVKRVYEKPSTKAKLIVMCKEWWKLSKSTWSDDSLEIRDIDGNVVTLDYAWCYSNTFSYEDLLEMDGVYFSSMYVGKQYVPSITAYHKMSVTIDGIEFKMGQHFEVEIPADDLATLRLLGKVKDDISEPSVSTTVFCEFG